MSSSSAFDQHCQCPCGTARFSVQQRPLLRFLCHCTICQRFNDAPFADVSVVLSRKVTPPPAGTVSFGTYRPPPAVQRGKCTQCDRPAIEFMRLPPIYPALTFVPSVNFVDDMVLPPPAMHTFYEKRQADADDELPKYQGYVRSQLAFTRRLYSALLRGHRAH